MINHIINNLDIKNIWINTIPKDLQTYLKKITNAILNRLPLLDMTIIKNIKIKTEIITQREQIMAFKIIQ